MSAVSPSTSNLQPMTRRGAIKGLAGILAAGVAPALWGGSTGGLRRGIGARMAAFSNGNSEEEMYKELYLNLCQGVDALVAKVAPTDNINITTPTSIGTYGIYAIPYGDYTFENVINVGGLGITSITSGAKIRLPNCTGISSISIYSCTNAEIHIKKLNHITLSSGSANVTVYWADGIYKGDGTYVGPLPS